MSHSRRQAKEGDMKTKFLNSGEKMQSTKVTDLKTQRPVGHHCIAPSGFAQSGSNMQEMVETHDRSIDLMVQKQEEKQALAVIEQVIMQGDLSMLNPQQRVLYYRKVCESVGLNPFTRPFDYMMLNGKLTLYAKKDATEQLRKVNGISIERLEDRVVDDLYIVKAFANTKDGRTDAATGAVTIGHLKGEAKGNAIMKAETKAKRRVTLSISGMGWTDESEVESIPGAKTIDIDMHTGEIKGEHVLVAREVKQVTVQKKTLSQEQINELEEILSECDDKYKKCVYDYMKKVFGSEDLKGAPQELYDRIKNAAMQNAREAFDRKNNAIKTEEMVTA